MVDIGWLVAFTIGVFAGAGAFIAGHEYCRIVCWLRRGADPMSTRQRQGGTEQG